MEETFYRTGTYDTDHSEFGGRIYASDFNRKTTLAEAAARIMADRQFTQQCQKNASLSKLHRGTIPASRKMQSELLRKMQSQSLQKEQLQPLQKDMPNQTPGGERN